MGNNEREKGTDCADEMDHDKEGGGAAGGNGRMPSS